jgi:nucleotide-binding universal stress UspA family protein
MFSRILVPVDLSDRNAPALEAASDLARAGRGSILLLHVIEEIEGVPPRELEDFYRDLGQRAEAALDALGSDLEKRGVQVETRIRRGRRWTEIVDCAAAEGCDLVLLRSHVLDPAEPLRGVGTISHQVALAARCAVLLVR